MSTNPLTRAGDRSNSAEASAGDNAGASDGDARRSVRDVRLSAGDASVTIDVGHGGRLASFEVGGRELLLGPPNGTPDGSISWGSFLMAPWPGRLANGTLGWRGRAYQLPRTHGRHAIHGLVAGAPWSVESTTRSDARLVIELGPLGWPFGGRVWQRIALEADRLVLEAEIEADEPMPAALGWHPWFDRRRADPRLTVHANEVLVLDDMIPTGKTEPVGGRTDLRTGPGLGRRRLDHVYADARSPAVIEWPDLRLSIAVEPPLSTVVVHTPPRGFCVEPQTAWPNAFGAELAAGRSFRARTVWRWAATHPGP